MSLNKSSGRDTCRGYEHRGNACYLALFGGWQGVVRDRQSVRRRSMVGPGVVALRWWAKWLPGGWVGL